jgi:hypothetical protein
VPTPTVIEPSDILTPRELAARLHVKVSWLYERTRRGEALPHFKVGRYQRYSWAAVCAWLHSVHVAGCAAPAKRAR